MVDALRNAAVTYRVLAGARLRSDLQYRLSFALFTLGQFAINFLDFVAILIVFSNVSSLKGWSVGEVAFLYGLGNLAFALGDVFVSAVENVQFHVKEGSFDRFLLRPASPLVQVIADQFSLRRVGKLAEGLLIFTFGCGAASIDWTLPRAAMTAVALLCGAVIFSSLWIFTSCLCFWWVDAREAANAVTYGGGFLAQYPLAVYGDVLRRVLAFGVPVAFANYFPAVYVLGRTDRLGAPTWIQFATPAVAAIAALAAGAMWRTGVRHYRSTGS
ncbi:MAG TPA: ABC-2 family transporter protein [Acidimicrobiales bacterium]|nr:ABC-2 family transporter protein [Acidimicrobiales bacterium]